MPGAAGLGRGLKRHSLRLYHSKGGPCIRCGVCCYAHSSGGRALVYWRLARQVVRDVTDYERSGVAVASIIGIGASPSCGVTTTLDLRASLEVVASCPAAALTRDVMNEQAVLGCRRPGEGLFIKALDRQLKRRGITVPALEHDLAAELRGKRQTLLATPAPRTLGTALYVTHTG